MLRCDGPSRLRTTLHQNLKPFSYDEPWALDAAGPPCTWCAPTFNMEQGHTAEAEASMASCQRC